MLLSVFFFVCKSLGLGIVYQFLTISKAPVWICSALADVLGTRQSIFQFKVGIALHLGVKTFDRPNHLQFYIFSQKWNWYNILRNEYGTDTPVIKKMLVVRSKKYIDNDRNPRERYLKKR